jgi:surface polysaccharide O-acyltransferase-like enzyme
MFMVVILHVLLQGGILKHSGISQTNYGIAWLFETAAFCAVNCYALISGYVGVDSKFRYTSLFVHWLQVAFYSVGITLVLQNFFPKFLGTTVLSDSFFPVMRKYYWYFTCYIAVALLSPFLNRFIKSLDRRAARNLCLTVFFGISVFNLFTEKDMFVLSNGYSAVWLLLLYLVGGCFKRHEFFKKTPKLVALLVYVASVLAAWWTKLCIERVPDPESLPKFMKADFLINYTAPTILLSAIALLVLFSNIKKVPRIFVWGIKLLSPLAFSVYIIHTHPSIWSKVMRGRFAAVALREPHELIFGILLSAASVFFMCAAVDLVRHLLFTLLGIKKHLNRLEDNLPQLLRRLGEAIGRKRKATSVPAASGAEPSADEASEEEMFSKK